MPATRRRQTKAQPDTSKQSREASTTQKPSTTQHGGKYPVTPDGHYFVVRGRLWRCTDPSLTDERRSELTKQLMDARRAIGALNRSKRSKDGSGGDDGQTAMRDARDAVQKAKEGLGERGDVWWNKEEGEVCDRKMVWNTGYKHWWQQIGGKVN